MYVCMYMKTQTSINITNNLQAGQSESLFKKNSTMNNKGLDFWNVGVQDQPICIANGQQTEWV